MFIPLTLYSSQTSPSQLCHEGCIHSTYSPWKMYHPGGKAFLFLFYFLDCNCPSLLYTRSNKNSGCGVACGDYSPVSPLLATQANTQGIHSWVTFNCALLHTVLVPPLSIYQFLSLTPLLSIKKLFCNLQRVLGFKRVTSFNSKSECHECMLKPDEKSFTTSIAWTKHGLHTDNDFTAAMAYIFNSPKFLPSPPSFFFIIHRNNNDSSRVLFHELFESKQKKNDCDLLPRT